jgi:hypothetical protein
VPAAARRRPAAPEADPPDAAPRRPAAPEPDPPGATPGRPAALEPDPPEAAPRRPAAPEPDPPDAASGRPAPSGADPPDPAPCRPAAPEVDPPDAAPCRPAAPEADSPDAASGRPAAPGAGPAGAAEPDAGAGGVPAGARETSRRGFAASGGCAASPPGAESSPSSEGTAEPGAGTLSSVGPDTLIPLGYRDDLDCQPKDRIWFGLRPESTTARITSVGRPPGRARQPSPAAGPPAPPTVRPEPRVPSSPRERVREPRGRAGPGLMTMPRVRHNPILHTDGRISTLTQVHNVCLDGRETRQRMPSDREMAASTSLRSTS